MTVPEPDVPDFFPAGAQVFDYHRRELARIAREVGRSPAEIFSRGAELGRSAVFDALQLLCSWKHINRQALSDIERFTLCFPGLAMEVHNGGFHQYFSNSAGDDWDIFAWGLHHAGDTAGLSRFQAVLALFHQRRPFRNRQARNQQLEDMGETEYTAFEPFNTQFYAHPFLDWDKSWALIASRAAQFSFEWPEGIGDHRFE